MKTVAEHLKNTQAEALVDVYENKKSRQEVLVVLSDKIFSVVKALKQELFFDVLIDIVSVDWQNKKPTRFELNYFFYHTKENRRVQLKVYLTNNISPCVSSLVSLYAAADWAEREAYDMMGIVFEGHPYLKRLLMWDEFQGHPLRKDYPLNKRQAIPETKEIL